MTATDRLTQLEPRQQPAAKDLIAEVREALLAAQSLGVFDKINAAHQTRRCLWRGQSDDGMLHGDDAFPWHGAIDSRVPLAEEIVADHVRIRMAAVRAGNVQIGPQDDIADSGKARTWNDVLRYYRLHGRVKRKLHNNLRLYFTCVEEFGYGVMKVDWRDRQALKPQQLTLGKVIAFVMEEVLADMRLQAQLPPESETPPDWQNSAADAAAIEVEEMFSTPELKWQAVQLLLRLDPTLTKREALRIVKPLAVKQEATYYAARGEGGLPVAQARIPWVNCLHGMDLGMDGETSWWADVERLSELDFRVRCAQEGCTDEWRDAVLGQPNKGFTDLLQTSGVLPAWVLNGVGLGLSPEENTAARAPLFEVVTLYRMAVNEAGIPAVYESMVHAQVPELLGKHECCAVAELPFVCEMREPAALAVQSRGVPELSLTDQLALKKLKDATTASAELAAFPPYERAMGDSNRIKPGQELPARRNTGSAGTQSRFLDVPGVDLGALKAMEMCRADVNRMFMRGDGVDPDSRNLFLQDMGENAVLSFEEIIRLIWLHIQAYVPELTASRIAGRAVSVKATAEDLEGTADIHVQFSAMALNQKTALELAEYGTKIAGLDRNGRIDFGKFVEVITRVFDPVLSENIILPAEEATAEIEKDEQAVIAAISSGQYVTGRVNSPQARYKILQQWLANPQTVPLLQGNPMIYAALQQHMAGLTQQQVQFSTNVFTGQTGQKPQAPWEEQEQPEAALKSAVEGGGMPGNVVPMAA